MYVVYTRWKNLKKTKDMVDGQVSFHRPDNVRRCRVEKNNPIVRQIEKTKQELYPNLYQLQQDRMTEIQQEQKQLHKQQLAQQEQLRRLAEQEKEERSYDRIFKEENMTKTSDLHATADATAAEEYEDDFF